MSETIDASEEGLLKMKFLELTKPANPAKHNEEKAIDVVALHGLNGGVDASHWTNEDGSLWLRDLLPKDIRHVRVLELTYDPRELLTGSADAGNSLVQFLLARLSGARENTPKTRPVVFLAHGFGGFVVEKIVNHLAESETAFTLLKQSIKKIIFLSTPQRAPNETQWHSLLSDCIADCVDLRTPFFSRSHEEPSRLLRDSQAFLQQITANFIKNVARLKIKIFSCYEQVPTPPREKCSVNESTAALDLKLEKLRAMPGCTHLSLAKYCSREDENYQAIVSAIKKVLRSASAAKPAPTGAQLPPQINISVNLQPTTSQTSEKAPTKSFSEIPPRTTGVSLPDQRKLKAREVPAQLKTAPVPQQKQSQPPNAPAVPAVPVETVLPPRSLNVQAVQKPAISASEAGYSPFPTGPPAMKSKLAPQPDRLPHSGVVAGQSGPRHLPFSIQAVQTTVTASSHVTQGPSSRTSIMPQLPLGTRELPSRLPPMNQAHPEQPKPAVNTVTSQTMPKVAITNDKPVPLRGTGHGQSQAASQVAEPTLPGTRSSPAQGGPGPQRPPKQPSQSAPYGASAQVPATVQSINNNTIQNVAVHTTRPPVSAHVDPTVHGVGINIGRVPPKASTVLQQKTSAHGPSPSIPPKQTPPASGPPGYKAFQPFSPPKGAIPFRPGLVHHSQSTTNVLTMSSGQVQGPNVGTNAPSHPEHRHSVSALPSALTSGPAASKGYTAFSALGGPPHPPKITQTKTPASLFPGPSRGSVQPDLFAQGNTKSTPAHADPTQTAGIYVPLQQPKSAPGPTQFRPFSMSGPSQAPQTTGPIRTIPPGKHIPSSSLPGHLVSGPPSRPTGSTQPIRPFSMTGPSAAPPLRPPALGTGPVTHQPHRPFSISGPSSNLLPGGGRPSPPIGRKPPPTSLMSGPPGPRPPISGASLPKSAHPPNRHSISGPPPLSLPKGLQPGPAPPAKPGFLGSFFGSKQPAPPRQQPPRPAVSKPPPPLKPHQPPSGPGPRPPPPRPLISGPPGPKPLGPPKPAGPKPTPGAGYQPYRGPQKPPGKLPGPHAPPLGGRAKHGPGGKPPGHHPPHHGPPHGPAHGGNHHGPQHGGHSGPHHGPHHGPDHGHGHGWFDWLHGGKHHPTGTNVLVDPAHVLPNMEAGENKPTETNPEETKPPAPGPDQTTPPIINTEETKPTDTKPEDTTPPGPATEESKPTVGTKPEDEGIPTAVEVVDPSQVTQTKPEDETKPTGQESGSLTAALKPQDAGTDLEMVINYPGAASQVTGGGEKSQDDPNGTSSTAGAPNLPIGSAPHFTFIQSQSQMMYNMYSPYRPESSAQPPAMEPETARSLDAFGLETGFAHQQTIDNAHLQSGDDTLMTHAGQPQHIPVGAPHPALVQPKTVYDTYPMRGDNESVPNGGQTRPASQTGPGLGFVKPQTVYSAYVPPAQEVQNPDTAHEQTEAEPHFGFVLPETGYSAYRADASKPQGTSDPKDQDSHNLDAPDAAARPPVLQTHTAVFPDFASVQPQPAASQADNSPHLGSTQPQTGYTAYSSSKVHASTTVPPATAEHDTHPWQYGSLPPQAGFEPPEIFVPEASQPPPVLLTHSAVFPDFHTMGSSHVSAGQERGLPTSTEEPVTRAHENIVPPATQPMHPTIFPDFRDIRPQAPSDHITDMVSESNTVSEASASKVLPLAILPDSQGKAIGDNVPLPNNLGIYYPPQEDLHPVEQDKCQPPPVLPAHTAVFPGVLNSDILRPVQSNQSPEQQNKDVSGTTSGYPTTGAKDIGPGSGPEAANAGDLSGDNTPRNLLGIYYPSEQNVPQSLKTAVPIQREDGLRIHGESGVTDQSAVTKAPAEYHPAQQYVAFSHPASADMQQPRDLGIGTQTPGVSMQALASTDNPARESVQQPPVFTDADQHHGFQPSQYSPGTSPPGEAATYYESFDKPNPFPPTSSQYTTYQGQYQAPSNQTQQPQLHPPQPGGYAPYVTNQEYKKSSSGTALKVAAGVAAGAAVAGLATAAVMHALHDSQDTSATGQTDGMIDDVSRNVPGAAAQPQVETASVTDVDDSDEYASTVDSSDLDSQGGAQSAAIPQAHEDQLSGPQMAPAADQFANTHEVDNSHYWRSESESVADSSDFDTDDGHTDVEDDDYVNVAHDSTPNDQEHGPYADAGFGDDQYLGNDRAINESEFSYHADDHLMGDTNGSDPSVSDSDDHEIPHSYNPSVAASDEYHQDEQDSTVYNANIFDPAVADSWQEEHDAPDSDGQSVSDSDNYTTQADTDEEHDSDQEVGHEVGESDDDDHGDTDEAETGYHDEYPYQPQEFDQENQDEDSDDDGEAGADPSPYTTGYWEEEDKEDEEENDEDENSEVAFPHTQHPSGYWEGDDDEQEESSDDDEESGDEDHEDDEPGGSYQSGSPYQNQYQQDSDSDSDDNDDEEEEEDEDEDQQNAYQSQYHHQSQYQAAGEDEDDDDEEEDEDEDENTQQNAYPSQYHYQNQYQAADEDEDDEDEEDEEDDDDEDQYQYQADYQLQYQEPVYQQEYPTQYEEPVYRQEYQYQEPVYQEEYQAQYDEPVYQEQYPVYQEEYEPEPEYYEEQVDYGDSGGYDYDEGEYYE